jgi:electron transport complex protein RnfD
VSRSESGAPEAKPLVGARPRFHLIYSPFLHAPESANTVFVVTFAAACIPLLGGLAMFGWRAGVVTALSIASCVTFEKLFFRVVRAPALLGRSHAWLTGLLLALTLPAGVAWYVPVIAGAFAIILGKAIFGGVGHFLWQPALVGRLAVTVLFPALLAGTTGPVLARHQLFRGDIRAAEARSRLDDWSQARPAGRAEAFQLPRVQARLREVYNPDQPTYSGIAFIPPHLQRRSPAPPLLSRLPTIQRMVYGARPGPIGATSAALLIAAGLYLIYRNYLKPHLPLAMLLSAAVVAAILPVHLTGLDGRTRTVWYPFLAEGAGVGFAFLIYHLTSGGMLLAAFLLATEMTSRPVTRGGQVIFGALCGALAIVLRIYTSVPIPVFMAVLVANTFTPLIDAIWRPRVLGQSFWARYRLG